MAPAGCYSNRWLYIFSAFLAWFFALTKVTIEEVRNPAATTPCKENHSLPTISSGLTHSSNCSAVT